MSDAENRTRARAAAQNPSDDLLAMQAGADRLRSGALTDAQECLTHVGTWVYAEGIRMNYRGILQDVILDAAGEVCTLILSPGYRVGEWNASGPVSQYEAKNFGGRRMLRWDSVCEFGSQPADWPTV